MKSSLNPTESLYNFSFSINGLVLSHLYNHKIYCQMGRISRNSKCMIHIKSNYLDLFIICMQRENINISRKTSHRKEFPIVQYMRAWAFGILCYCPHCRILSCFCTLKISRFNLMNFLDFSFLAKDPVNYIVLGGFLVKKNHPQIQGL